MTSNKRISPTLVAAFLGVVLALGGCSQAEPSEASGTTTSGAEAAFAADHGLEGLSARQIIDRLDATSLADRPKDLVASIRPSELQLSDSQGREVSLPMPQDEFYLSFAPYVNQTHECHFHSLTTCTGELQNQDVHVTVVDNATGEAIVDEDLQTYDNGFLGIWLPRGIEATLTVDDGSLKGTSAISTSGDDSATCLTTLQLTES